MWQLGYYSLSFLPWHQLIGWDYLKISPHYLYSFFYWTLSIFMLVRLGCFIFISHCKKLHAFFFLLNPAPIRNCHPPLYKSFSFLTTFLCIFLFIASKLQGTNAITIHLSLCFLFLNSKVMILLEDGNYLGW